MSWDSMKSKCMYNLRKSQGLCVKCGKVKAAPGIIRCRACNNKANRHHCDSRSKKHLERVDKLINKGLISTPEAAQILGVTPEYMSKLGRRGKLKVRTIAPYSKTPCCWFLESDITRYKEARKRYCRKKDPATGRFVNGGMVF